MGGTAFSVPMASVTSIPFHSSAGGLPGIDSLLHASARTNPDAAREHRVFIACHLGAGIAALAALPLYLVFARAVDGPTAVLATMLTLPLGFSLYVMRTGALDRAHALSIGSAAVLLTALTAMTGGLFSGAIPALAIVLGLGFALGSARTRGVVVVVTVGALIALVAGHQAGMVVDTGSDALLPLPAWTAGLLVAFPAILHAMVWMASARAAHAEFARLAEEEGLRNKRLLDAACDLVTLHNGAGNLVYASQATTRLLGVEPTAIRDAGLFNRIHVADRPAFLRLLDVAQMGKETESADIRVRLGDADADGPRFGWFEMRCRAMPGSRDVIAILRETGERKAHEDERDAAVAEAQRANAMKTRFLASVSHELRTPLNAIIGFSEVLTQELFGALENDKYQEYAELILQSGRHLLDVVNDILDMSKIEAGKFEIFPEPFHLENVLRQSAAMLEGRAGEKGVRINLAIEPQLPELNADQRSCKQICLNLLSNAVKFTRENTAEGEGRVTLSAIRRGRFLEIAVRDNGIGIAPEDVAHVGEPFYQAHSTYARNFEGTGLGLSVVRGLVELHGGRFALESTLGQGTTVTVALPIDGPEAGDEEAEGKTAHLTHLRPRSGPVTADPRCTVSEDLATVEELVRKTA